MLAELHRERCERALRLVNVTVGQISIQYKEKPGLALGSIAWPGSLILCNYLYENPIEVSGKSCLELGCGVGICSILCAKLGGIVTCTDKLDSIQIAKENAELNSVNIICESYLWANNSLGHYNVIFASDVIYYDHQHGLLLLALEANSRIGTVFILAYTKRSDLETPFFAQLHLNWSLKSSTPMPQNYQILTYIRFF
jgi:predicted nicotinamide N-methyase